MDGHKDNQARKFALLKLTKGYIAANRGTQFASLTPLEPRLVKKLIRPLTNIIQTTSAMSLLYECINGIIQGGILDGVEGIREGEVIAQLCVDKLRGMLVLEEDPNCKLTPSLAVR